MSLDLNGVCTQEHNKPRLSSDERKNNSRPMVVGANSSLQYGHGLDHFLPALA